MNSSEASYKHHLYNELPNHVPSLLNFSLINLHYFKEEAHLHASMHRGPLRDLIETITFLFKVLPSHLEL